MTFKFGQILLPINTYKEHLRRALATAKRNARKEIKSNERAEKDLADYLESAKAAIKSAFDLSMEDYEERKHSLNVFRRVRRPVMCEGSILYQTGTRFKIDYRQFKDLQMQIFEALSGFDCSHYEHDYHEVVMVLYHHVHGYKVTEWQSAVVDIKQKLGYYDDEATIVISVDEAKKLGIKYDPKEVVYE